MASLGDGGVQRSLAHCSTRQQRLILALVLLSVYACGAADWRASNVGRVFSFLIPGVGVQDNGPVVFITSTAPSSTDGEPIQVRATVPQAEFATSIHVRPGSTGMVQLPSTAIGETSGPQQRGTVRIEASLPVAVQVVVHSGRPSGESFLALPFDSLGMEYITPSTSPDDQLRGQALSMLTITGVCDATSVSIKVSNTLTYNDVEYRKGRTIRLTINSGESVQIYSEGALTGTRVTSDKPIAVLSANDCPDENAEDNLCDYVVEQLLPVFALGKRFLVAPLSNDPESYYVDVSVLATRPDTVVEIPNQGSVYRRKLGRGEEWYLPQTQTNRPLLLEADSPVQVTLHSWARRTETDCEFYRGDCNRRSKTMTILPPLEQFQDRADFTVWNTSVLSLQSDGRRFENVLTILTTTECDKALSSGLVTLADQLGNITWTKETVLNNSDACVLRANVPPGIYHLNSRDGVKFTALLYSTNGYDAYSNPAATGATHLGYISRESERHECLLASAVSGSTFAKENPCEDDPCKNGGECVSDGTGGYQCNCVKPFREGPHCETVVNVCSLETQFCFHGGNCSFDGYFTCDCPQGWTGRHCEFDTKAGPKSTSGREFVLTFMEHPSSLRRPSLVISTAGNNTEETLVNVTIPSVAFTKTLFIQPNSVEELDLPSEAISLGSRRQLTGVLVQASQDVTVVGIHNSIAPGDGFLALPVDALGTKHHVITPRQRKKRPAEKSQIAIVAVEDDTIVFVSNKKSVVFQEKTYAWYSLITVRLQRLEVAQLQSQFDLTETQVLSNKPVAVLSGSTCGYTMFQGNDQKSCSFMVEQMLPMRSWGKRYVVSPFLGNGNGATTVRIIGGPAIRTIAKGSYGNTAYLSQGSMEERYITEPSFLMATGPIFVVAFSVASDCKDRFDCQTFSVPTMTTIPPLDQLTTSATFTTLAIYTSSAWIYHYINIITSDCSDMNLLTVTSQLGKTFEWDEDATETVPGTDFCLMSKEVLGGTYHITSTSGNVPFSARLYGFSTHRTGYSFPLSMDGRRAEEFQEDMHSSGTFGTEFVVGFISGGNYFPTRGPRLLITAATNVNQTHVEVSGAGYDVTLILEPNQTKVVDIPSALSAVDGHVSYPDVAVHVRSSEDVLVFGMNDAYGLDADHKTVSDGYHALPVHALGREYAIVTSWPVYQYPNSFTQFIIIATEDHTRVDVKLNAAAFFENHVVYGGQVLTLNLHRNQAAYFKSFNDQTGTYVASTKPVAVISGTDCGYSPRYPDDGPADYPCDHQVEFLTPYKRWGNTFLVAPLQGYTGGDIYIRSQTLHDFTKIKYTSGSTQQQHRLEDFNTPVPFKVGPQGITNHAMIESEFPLSVSAFAIYQPLTNCQNTSGTCEGYSRPVLFSVPPVESFKQRLVFPSYRVRGAHDMATFADIYTKCSEAEYVRVNGVLQSWEKPLEEIARTGYCVLRLQLSSKDVVTTYIVDSLLESGRLGVITYGFSSRSGYAFPGGI